MRIVNFVIKEERKNCKLINCYIKIGGRELSRPEVVSVCRYAPSPTRPVRKYEARRTNAQPTRATSTQKVAEQKLLISRTTRTSRRKGFYNPLSSLPTPQHRSVCILYGGISV